MQLVDDRFRFYLADPTVFDPLANDLDLPSGATIELLSNFFEPGVDITENGALLTLDGSSPRAQQTRTILSFEERYNVRDADGNLLTEFGVPLRAEILFEGMQGVPGLGGAFGFSLNGLSESDGTIRIDVSEFIDPKDDYAFSIQSAGGSISQVLGNYNVEVEVDIDGDELVIDSSQWAYLDSGQTSTVGVEFVVTNGTETVSNQLFLGVSGVTTAGQTVTTSTSGGVQVGTDGDDRIVSVANEANVMTGGSGEDTFVFGSDYSDGNADFDTITDFEAGLDLIQFSNGVLVAEILPIQDGLAIFTRDGDVLNVFGDGLDLRDVRMEGVQFFDPDTQQTLDVQDADSIALDFAVIQTIQTLDYWY